MRVDWDRRQSYSPFGPEGDPVKRVGTARFKEECVTLLERLDPDGLVVTKHGKPIARVYPYGRTSADLIGCLQGRIVIEGNILSTGRGWDVVP